MCAEGAIARRPAGKHEGQQIQVPPAAVVETAVQQGRGTQGGYASVAVGSKNFWKHDSREMQVQQNRGTQQHGGSSGDGGSGDGGRRRWPIGTLRLVRI